MSEARLFMNFINGEFVPSLGGKTFERRNPADTADVVGIFQDSNADDVEAAVTAAKAAYATWRKVPAPRRGEILLRAADLLLARKDRYSHDLTREMGKPLFEAGGDIVEAIGMAQYAGSEGRRMHGVTTPSELPNKFQMSMRQPIGVIGMITPWNFPMAIASWKMLPALVCGNTVVIKPGEDASISTFNLVECLVEAGLPPGVVNIVTGHGPSAGQPLVEHPDVPVLSFTGSTEVGRLVYELGARQIKRVSLEMGGKNPLIVMDDADLDLVEQGVVWAAFGTTGQRCTATSRVIVHRKVAATLIERLVARAQALRVGNGLHPATEMGPLVNEAQLERVLGYIEVGKAEGATLCCGGNRLTEGSYANGWFVQPTIFTGVRPTMRIAREEIFGPVLSVIEVESLDEALAVANDVAYGLSSSIYTRDINAAYRAMHELEAGIVYINAPTIGAEIHLPFGGVKATGNGHREAGPTMLDVFSEWKSVYVDYSGSLQRAQIDNAD
ncbi:aldehyde dehydrogenase family protein [Candidatus Chloroploca sp. M-50]|uniref:Aldehyde dehydrogenase family protein n=1 Tax=Candidatus Chloroploca mongolica TaxID=2528176 RepID=A0ABS4D898_9CHLR|nr:aldehyde dehydrogenase family protein [Candidatus Chloroploca mongolica]MBP1465652.1 aldehyde dehydrogenase family protein [Candidatus Chloroploca mongolica]